MTKRKLMAVAAGLLCSAASWVLISNGEDILIAHLAIMFAVGYELIRPVPVEQQSSW